MNFLPYILVLLAAMLWGTTGTSQTFIEGAAHPLTIGALRLSIGGFSLLAFVLWAKMLNVKTIPWKAAWLSAAAMALFQPLFFSSVQLTGIAVGTVVAIGSAPVFTGILEWAFMKKNPDRVWMIATSCAIAGCILLFSNTQSATINSFGVLLALGAGLSFAGYAIVSKSVLHAMEAVPAVAVIFSLSALFLLPFLLFLDVSYIQVPKNVGVIMYLGIAATGLSYILFSKGLKQIPSSSAVTLSLAEPLTASLLGVLVVGETLNGTAWTGVFLLLCGIVVLTLAKKKPIEKKAASS
ncbi:DME family drug/metabolite transporter [Planomicrobium soli]|uniref:DME family drug/metabolite transporter n=1 Tax=Planomicrobium soli TaxID=1176648 RepID=A0A2P8GK05_9BACL|nr:EamA family transporter [Planomicrobium soli]PSL34280.1 DME family drug/metabolite transporter [Planomicrobium soli]